ncbi:hypothetical protein MKW92_032439 [Papaver armeniacum]|nr:hypothetical protein MKW92_032439 [Papaver armeniacum]
MVKDTRLDWKPWSVFKQSHFLVRFSVSVLVICLGFHIIYSTITSDDIYSIGFLSTAITKTSSVETSVSPPPAVPSVLKTADDTDTGLPAPAPSEDSAKLQTSKNQNQIPTKEKCDLSIGEWIPDPSGPMYNTESCANFLPDDQNCIKNGRPDSGFLYWRWKPRDCELPRFNAVKFLDSMRNKHWAIVGDSISRNHAQSLLCILSKVEAANEAYHDEGFRTQRWHFPSYNFSLTVIWSPFLVKASEDANVFRLDIDKLDKKWADQYTSFDYVIISCGRWFLRDSTYYENNTILGCHNCPGKNLTEYGLENGYRKALRTVFDFVQTSNHSAVVLYRTTTPVHFESGYANAGGTYDRTAPCKEGEIRLNNEEVIFRNVELEAFKDSETIGYSGKRTTMKLLNVSKLSLLRPDGHPGPYWHFHPLAEDKNATDPNPDYLHWCLPGPIDNWNDLIMEMVLND